MDDFWNNRYNQEVYVFGKEPNLFVREHGSVFPPGKILCLAEGEGRNGVFLASLGYDVTIVDRSEIGLQKAKNLAKEKNVSITCIQADLSDYYLDIDTWSGIVAITMHLPLELRQQIHAQIVQALVPGGMYLSEAYTPKQLTMPGRGGPKNEDHSVFYTKESLVSELPGLEFIVLQERDRVVDEGPGHQGLSAVLQVLAQKPNP
jgi:SAM-dependent methyltransferase